MKKENKFKITKSQLAQIIKEEYASMSKDNARAGEIKARLARINKELGGLPQTLSEVEASGTKKVSATGWTGAGKNDVKYGEKFEKIGSHLKEDDELEGEMEIGGEDIESTEGGYFEMKFAELGRDIDGKIDGGDVEDEIEVELGDDMDVDMGDMDSEEEDIETIEIDAEDENEEEDAEDEEEVEEINEDLNEPIEGETPAQDSDARFNDYMEKDSHVNESAKYGSKVLSEGFTSAKKTALSSELERMRNLAKIGR